jgi:hypothetical protein
MNGLSTEPEVCLRHKRTPPKGKLRFSHYTRCWFGYASKDVGSIEIQKKQIRLAIIKDVVAIVASVGALALGIRNANDNSTLKQMNLERKTTDSANSQKLFSLQNQLIMIEKKYGDLSNNDSLVRRLKDTNNTNIQPNTVSLK